MGFTTNRHRLSVDVADIGMSLVIYITRGETHRLVLVFLSLIS